MTEQIVFWDIDTQHDFMDRDGKLPVPAARLIVPNLARLTQFAAEHGIPVVATADAHPPGDPEFEEFGEHCVPGTHGQRRIQETRLPDCETAGAQGLEDQVARLRSGELSQLVVEKRALDVFTVPLADAVLSALRPDRIIVYGVATEYCVRAEVLSLAERGHAVTVVTDAVKAIGEEAGHRAMREMQEAGAEMADTDTVLAALTAELGR